MYWLRYLEHYRTDDSARLPIIRDTLNRIASHTELPDLIEQELLDAPGPVLEVPYLNTDLYGTDLRKMHNSLIDALERVKDI